MSSDKEGDHMLGLDFETFSEVDLGKHGLDRYASHPSTRVLLASVARPDEPTVRLDFVFDRHAGDKLRGILAKDYATQIAAHNASFEWRMLKLLNMELPFEYLIDTATIARAAGAAGKLEAAAPQLLGVDKMEDGRDLIKLFSMPQKDGTILVDNPEAWDAETLRKWGVFGDYCDVDSELSRYLALLKVESRTFSEKEQGFDVVTRRMNETGWPVDLELVHEMQQAYKENLVRIEEQFRQEHDPNGELNFRSTPQLRKWCGERGVKVTSLDELNLAKLLKRVRKRMTEHRSAYLQNTKPPTGPSLDELAQVEAMLTTKQELGGSSLTKLQTIIDMTGHDGRLRNQYLHVGAGQTYRTSGRGVQMQNLKRLGPEPDEVSSVFTRHPDGSDWDNAKLARNLRQVFAPKHIDARIIVGDFSSVESRGLAYLAGEEWKLDGYSLGRDMYKVLAAKMLGTTYEAVDKQQRMTGKVGELSCGYGAGAGAVSTFAEKMNVDIDEVKAGEIVRDWRDANPRIVALWQRLDDALHDVVEHGRKRRVLALPLGDLFVEIRQISTPGSLLKEMPQTRSIVMMLQGPHSDIKMQRTFHGAYMHGRDVCYVKPSELKNGKLWRPVWTKNGQSGRYKIYGGKLAGILTQSFCREIFFLRMRELEDRLSNVENVQIIGQFHDEIVLEWTPPKLMADTAFTIDHDTAVKTMHLAMSEIPQLPGFPLAAEVNSAYRYIK